MHLQWTKQGLALKSVLQHAHLVPPPHEFHVTGGNTSAFLDFVSIQGAKLLNPGVHTCRLRQL
eukprot:3814124-Amphidinium_carterae.1